MYQRVVTDEKLREVSLSYIAIIYFCADKYTNVIENFQYDISVYK